MWHQLTFADNEFNNKLAIPLTLSNVFRVDRMIEKESIRSKATKQSEISLFGS